MEGKCNKAGFFLLISICDVEGKTRVVAMPRGQCMEGCKELALALICDPKEESTCLGNSYPPGNRLPKALVSLLMQRLVLTKAVWLKEDANNYLGGWCRGEADEGFILTNLKRW